MQHIYFQCQICEKSVFWKTSAIGVPIGKGMLCPHCASHYVLELRLLKSSSTVTTNFQRTLNENNTMPIQAKLKTLASSMIFSTDEKGIRKVDTSKIFLLSSVFFYWFSVSCFVVAAYLSDGLPSAFVTLGLYSVVFSVFPIGSVMLREHFEK